MATSDTDRAADAAIVQSVDRAARILELLTDHPELGVSDIARDLGVHRSTAFRLLATLESRNLVEQETHRGTYRLGLGVLRLAGTVAARIDLVGDAQVACDRVAQRLNETSNVAILDSGAAVNITQTLGAQMVAVTRQYVGRRTPLHCTSTGKVLLAHATDDVISQVLSAPLERFTHATLTDAESLGRELVRVRTNGWAAANEEWEPETNAVAVPVYGASPAGRRSDGDAVVAALSITAPAFRLAPSAFVDAAAVLREVADELGGRLGHVVPTAPVTGR
ncbi:IclR family transcriptional regulator [Gordonia jinhuaensis]|uniref:Glycerol operon regulatory protein n=1 Tax=Gordonia jinhuaensis TaxID=1517702 RepID=A0A916WSH9_9ACTN|nr:IclR family transcriptional regulator [Gordonia jinhuaensis]GGB25424.1 IclR family transcriptional regulator [Gordonia jinhuaensis]